MSNKLSQMHALRSFACAALFALAAACDRAKEDSPTPTSVGLSAGGVSGTHSAGLPADAPLAALQMELLQVAFDVATAIPVDPHIKDRSRAQEAVVEACLELDQAQRALEYIEQIDDWRRGNAYAALALYCAERGHAGAAEQYARRAAELAQRAEGWRRDRIHVTIAQAYVRLGRTSEAAQLETQLGESESAKLASVRTQLLNEEDFDAQMESIDRSLAGGTFDVIRNQLDALVQLFDRFYADKSRRSIVEQRIWSSWETLPVALRLEVLMSLASPAIEHADGAKAIELVDDAERMMAGSRWMPDYSVPLTARLGELRFRAGDADGGRRRIDDALALFEAGREQIINIDRADALRAVAAAYASIGAIEAAAEVCAKAVEAGVENPNSRPRAQDLSATCAMMARQWIESDAQMWTRLRAIAKGLGPPW